MILEQIGITDFGNLHDLVFEPGEGINLLEAPNESGKTTFASFLKFLFFGLPKATGKEDGSEWDRYLPWKGGSCAGYAVIRKNGKLYRLERTASLTGKNTHTTAAKIYALPSGAPITDDPGSFFLGVPETVFRRSAFVSQSDAAKLGGKELQSAIENILFSADEELNTQKALKKLNDIRTLLLYKNEKGGKIFDLQTEEDALDRRLTAAKEEEKAIAESEKSYAAQCELFAQKKKRAADAEKSLRHTDALRRLKQISAAREALTAQKQAEEERKRFLQNNPFGALLPDKDTEATLARLENDLLREEQLRADAARTVARQTAPLPDSLPDPMDAKEALDSCRKADATGKKLKICGILLLIIGLLAGIGGGVLLFTDKLPKIAPFFPPVLTAVALLPLIIGIVLLSLSHGKKNRVKKLLAEWNVQSPAALEERLEQMKKERTDAMRAQAERDAAIRQQKEHENRFAKLLEEAGIIASRWGMTIESPSDFPPLLTVIRQTLSENDRIQRKCETTKAAANASAVDYAPDEEERLQMILATDPDQAELSPEDYRKLKTVLNFERGTLETMQEKLHTLENSLTERKARAENPILLAQKILSIRHETGLLRKKYEGYRLAFDKLTEASDNLRRSLSPKLSEDASRFMEAASDGSYDRLLVDEGLKLRFLSEGSAHDAASFSSGTADLAYISLRLALIRLLYDEKEDKLPPLIFDESFVRLDDRRLSAILKVVAAYGAQVFLLTCHRREGRILHEVTAYTELHLPVKSNETV